MCHKCCLCLKLYYFNHKAMNRQEYSQALIGNKNEKL